VGRNRNVGRSSARNKKIKPHRRGGSEPLSNAALERAGPAALSARSLALTFTKSLLLTTALCAAMLGALALGSSRQDSSPPPQASH